MRPGIHPVRGTVTTMQLNLTGTGVGVGVVTLLIGGTAISQVAQRWVAFGASPLPAILWWCLLGTSVWVMFRKYR